MSTDSVSQDADTEFPAQVQHLLRTLPERVTRSEAAAVISQHFFRVSARTMEQWPVPARVICGRVHYETRDIIRYAMRRVENAPEAAPGRVRRTRPSKAEATTPELRIKT